MSDAMRLFEAVRHLDPIILTGLPRGKWAAPQKVRWAAEHFPGTRILTVMAVDRRNHAQEGSIFVHHRDAESTIVELAELGVPVRDIDQQQISAAHRMGGTHG